VLRTIRAAHEALENPRIAVSGVNPHALGEEEQAVIAPAIDAARGEGIAVDGPIGADALRSISPAGTAPTRPRWWKRLHG